MMRNEERKKMKKEIEDFTNEMLEKPVILNINKLTEVNKQNNKRSISDDENINETYLEDQEDIAQDDVSFRYKLPLNQTLNLISHEKSITCLTADPSGARLATGSMDYHVKLWDFAGMARNIRPFRSFEIEEGNPLVSLSYSPTGDKFIAATGSAQPKVLDREGLEIIQFTKGDMYVIDMINTKGHTHTVTNAEWNKIKKNVILTSSLDGTIREWNLETKKKKQFNKLVNENIIKCKSKQGKRIGVTNFCYNIHNYYNILAGTADGQIQSFDLRKSYMGRPTSSIIEAHDPYSTISCIRFAPNNDYIFASRSTDCTIKLWDIRKISKKKDSSLFKSFLDVECVQSNANFVFSPSGTSIVAGTSVKKSRKNEIKQYINGGKLKIFDVYNNEITEPIYEIQMENQDISVTSVDWHPLTNQVFAGLSTGEVKIYYDKLISKKGALLTSTKNLSQKDRIKCYSGVRIDGVGKIYNPHALPMYRESIITKKQKLKDRFDPKKTKIPEKPLTGPGVGGKINGSLNFTQFYMKDHIKKTFREEDPREAILQYNTKAKENPSFFGKAYIHSQPNDKMDPRYQLAEQTLEEEKMKEEEENKKLLL